MSIENKKTISVIILTYKPNNKLIKSISILLKQNYKIDEIILMNTEKDLFYNNLNNEEQGYIKNLEIEMRITIYNIKKEDFDHGITRNYASEKTNSDYILFMTDDSVPYDEDLIKNMINTFDNNVAIVTARQMPNEDASFVERLIRKFNYPDEYFVKTKQTEEKYGIKNYFCSNVCTMYDRKIFNELGRFPENIPLNEDSLFAYKALNNGYSLVYNNKCKTIHSHNLSHIEQFHRNYLIGSSHKHFKDIFSKLKSESEGKKLLSYVTKECIKEFKIFSLLNFYIDCVFRYLGYFLGKIFG